MTRLLPLGALPLTVYLLAGCTQLEPAAPKGAPAVQQASQALVSFDQVACRRRYAGIKHVAACPAGNADWALQTQVFDPTETGVLPDRMNDYCVYEWAHVTLPPANPTTLPENETATPWLTPDCYAVGTSAEITVELGEFMSETFNLGVDRPESLPGNPAVSLLAVVDTSPTVWDNGRPGSGQFQHGRSVATAARRLSCDNGDCAIDILPVLGLPRTDPRTVNTQNGGYFGYQSELAQGIYKAVQMWKNQASNRLVINLSVGWEGRFGGDLNNSNLRSSVRMVYDAIQYARCHGALVVAAAGNIGNSPNDAGPLYPAAWANVTAPDQTDCAGITPAGPNDVRINPSDGLVVPVSGVTRHDEPLRNARANTRTPLQAPGTNIAVWDVQNAQMRPALTGSSMSTAAVASALATLWAYRPQSGPHQIVDILYNNSVELADKADVCHGGTCPYSRRISLCTALNDLCQQANSRCAAYAEDCDPQAAASDFAPDVDAADRTALASVVDIDVDVEFDPTTPASYTDCDGNALQYDSTLSSTPVQQCFDGIDGRRVRPWVTPQPGPNSCDICALIGNGLDMRFDPSKGIYQVKDAVVHFTDGFTINSFDLTAIDTALGSMTAGDTYQLVLDPGFSTVKEGWINYTVNGVFETDTILIY